MKARIFFFAAMLFNACRCLGEDPIELTLCELMNSPALYNHKSIKISGVIHRGFEDFTLSDPHCKKVETVWLEFGGMKGAEITYAGGGLTSFVRKTPLIVENIETTLLQDAQFKEFERITKRTGTAKATLIGHYFSGEQQTYPDGTYWVGYGHMLMFSLLIIEQVVVAEANETK